MNTTCRAVASAGLMLAASTGAAEATVDRTVGPESGNSFDVLFGTPVTDATDLLSISSGSVSTGEGASLSISAIFENNSTFVIFSAAVSYSPTAVTLLSITNNNFTAFAAPQTVKGLRFTSFGGVVPANPSLPSGTIVSFDTVPEPTGAVLMLTALGVLAGVRRRKAA